MLYVGMGGWIGWLSWVIGILEAPSALIRKKENDKITIITRTAGSNQTTELCQGAALPVPIFIVQIFISKVVTDWKMCLFCGHGEYHTISRNME